MSQYFTPKSGREWRRVKRRDRSEGAASPVRHIDPATYQPSKEVLDAMQSRNHKHRRGRREWQCGSA
jgi:hypothetical protein